MKIPDLIVSRHRGAITWVARKLAEVKGWDVVSADTTAVVLSDGCAEIRVPVKDTVLADDIRDLNILGNLPLPLAALAGEVAAIIFDAGKEPRGQEYTPEDMDAAGAKVAVFVVARLE